MRTYPRAFSRILWSIRNEVLTTKLLKQDYRYHTHRKAFSPPYCTRQFKLFHRQSFIMPFTKTAYPIHITCLSHPPDYYEVFLVSYSTWAVNESPKAYFQPSPWQMSLLPQHPAGNNTCLIKLSPRIECLSEAQPLSRSSQDRLQPAYHCVTEHLTAAARPGHPGRFDRKGRNRPGPKRPYQGRNDL